MTRDVLAGSGDCFLDEFADGAGGIADVSLVEQGLAVTVVVGGDLLGTHGGYVHGDFMSQLTKFVGPGDEIRFAAELDERAERPARVDVGINHPLPGGAGRIAGRLWPCRPHE